MARMENPTKGARVQITRLRGYLLIQNRPMDCRTVCKCGACDGQSVAIRGTVEDLRTYSEDFNIVREATVRGDDGERYTVNVDQLQTV